MQWSRWLQSVRSSSVLGSEVCTQGSPLNLTWQEAASGFILTVEPLSLLLAELLHHCASRNTMWLPFPRIHVCFQRGFTSWWKLGHEQIRWQQGSLGKCSSKKFTNLQFSVHCLDREGLIEHLVSQSLKCAAYGLTGRWYLGEHPKEVKEQTSHRDNLREEHCMWRERLQKRKRNCHCWTRLWFGVTDQA